MKRFLNIALAVAVTAVVASCKDLLTEKPASYIDSSKLFSTLDGARMAVNGVYAVLCHPSHYGQFEMAMPTADDMYFVQGNATDGTRRDISHYQYTATNSWVETLWAYKYRGVDRANSVISNLREMSEYKDGDTRALEIEGEALFLRALLGFDIVRYWGDAPFKTEPSATYDDAYQPKKSRSEIYDIIVSDLETSAERLPWATAASNPERPTKGAAKGLLMRVLLHRAGYYLPSDAAVGAALVRPDDATRNAYFTKIRDLYLDFVSNGFHDLHPNYRTYWKGFCEKKYYPRESLYEIAFYTPDGGNQGGGTWGTWIGPLTDQNSKYSRANAFMYVVSNWKNYYQTKDSRLLTNICSYSIDKNSDSIPTANNGRISYPGKWRREWMTSPVKDLNNTDVNFVYLRYADVLLMASEAYNELGDSETAKSLINRVRLRAGADEWSSDADYTKLYVTGKLAAIATLIPDGTPQEKVRRALFWERGFECCYEGFRKYDLIRWGILYESVKACTWAYNGYNVGANANITKGKHELFPIPRSEMDINPHLKRNNPGF